MSGKNLAQLERMKETPILPSGIFVPLDEQPIVNDANFIDIQPMGKGAFCRVLRARRQGQLWCLKCLREEYRGSAFYEGLLRKEYALLCRLNHSFVVRAAGMETVEGLGECIVMEYVTGKTLDQAVGSRSDRRRWYEQLVEAVAYIHGQQVVHRDLKPQNVLITDNGQHVKLIDFGLADADNYAELKQAAGTPRYISPEQMEGGEADARNDIYSLGIILSEMRLGLAYRFVVWRCLRHLDGRYADADELLRAVRRARRWPQVTVMTMVVACLMAAVVWLSVAGLQRKAESSPVATVHAPDTVVLVAHPDSAPAPAVVAQKASPAASQDALPTVEKVYPKACAQVDKYMSEHHYADLLSTLQHEAPRPPFHGRHSERCNELGTAYTHFMDELWPEVEAIRDAYADGLGAVQASALYTSLVEYAKTKYANALYTAIRQYEEREQEYRRTLPSD